MKASDAPFVVTHASGLHAVAQQLSALHTEMLRIDTGEEQRAVRLSVLNLVAACTTVEDADLAMQTVGFLAQSHPARAIIVVASGEGSASIEADLSLQCAVRADGEICAEQIRLNVQGEPAHHLASVVTPLLVPDVPVYLWLVGSPPLEQAFGQDSIAICERMIIDTGAYEDAATTLTTIVRELGNLDDGLSLADLAWARSRAWRELLAEAFDGPDMRPFIGRITRVEVECCGSRPSSQAWLCAGWLSDRLGWESVGGPYIRTAAAEVDGVPEHDLTAVRVTCVGRGHNAVVTLERRDDTVYTTIDVDGGITTSRAVSLPDLDVVHLVGGLLEDQEDDPAYIQALNHAAVLATSRR